MIGCICDRQVVRIVEDMKGIAIDMGTKVDKQNAQLEIINKKVVVQVSI